jgi:crotonobetainyl-CoA:carnitine CoA-transferase CaiB-like acyl-CoA transferase
MPTNDLPLRGIRVVEFTHMVMGPTCGLILADLGADVIKVEPLEGDGTRRLLGSGAGFFALFNRNKRSLAVNVKDSRGLEIVLRLLADADVFVENFRAGTMDKLGLGPAALQALNPRLIQASHKGFLPGPYENRTALDEVVQMMGGLAYMTGRPGDPLRAGTSVNDIMGGMFGAIGVLAALQQRDRAQGGTGRGQVVQSALFENNVLLVAQHMMQFAVTGQPAAPMPSRISAWALYDVFTVQAGEQIFLAAVSDGQWAALCAEFAWPDWQSIHACPATTNACRRGIGCCPCCASVLRPSPPPNWRAALKRAACRTRPSCGLKTCSTTRTWPPPGGWRRWWFRPTPAVPAASCTPALHCCPWRWMVRGCRCAAAHRRWARRLTNCCANWATTTNASRSWPLKRLSANRHAPDQGSPLSGTGCGCSPPQSPVTRRAMY